MEFEKPVLYTHTQHPHYARNVNRLGEAELQASSLNQRIAVKMTRIFSSMWTFWAIVFWIALWVTESFLVPTFTDKMPWPMLLALASVPQLPLMIVIMVGQAVLGRKQEIQNEEAYQTTEKTYHDAEQMRLHQDAQDTKLIEMHEDIQQLRVQVEILVMQITAMNKPVAAKTTKKTETTK